MTYQLEDFSLDNSWVRIIILGVLINKTKIDLVPVNCVTDRKNGIV